eukprot:XP_011508102.1 ammonium transporter Rh type B isoform X4 [Homo sapiens]
MAGSPSRAAGRRLQLPLLCLFLQGATAVLFAVFVRYNHKTDAALWHRSNHSNADNEFYFRYPRTIFLWIFWPSFNAALTALGAGQHRTALNTYYSLAASTLGTFALSALVGEDGRLDMVHIQNAALAGGVVVGTSSEMMLTPFGALAAGFLAGTVSTLGYKFFTPILESKFKVQDTCGVHNLHGMPGVLGALLGVLVAGLATHEAYGDGLESVFPLIAEGQRSATSQAMHQLFGLFVTLMFASVGGGLGGLLLKLPFLDSPPDSQHYEDQVHWQVPGEHEDKAQRPLRVEEADTQA